MQLKRRNKNFQSFILLGSNYAFSLFKKWKWFVDATFSVSPTDLVFLKINSQSFKNRNQL